MKQLLKVIAVISTLHEVYNNLPVSSGAFEIASLIIAYHLIIMESIFSKLVDEQDVTW